jgi:hypothetical protein
MIFREFEAHVAKIGLATEDATVEGQEFLVIKGVRIPGGSRIGQECQVAIRRSDQNPWLPEAQVHVRPHLVEMGQRNSQASPLGAEWQYLSRRFDPPPTPHTYYAFILTVLGEI